LVLLKLSDCAPLFANFTQQSQILANAIKMAKNNKFQKYHFLGKLTTKRKDSKNFKKIV
jgi:hypothetical protein